jgi:hypothetical protein
MPAKRVQFDDETWRALDLLARDSMKDFQELADEAFADLLKKHGRPTDLKSALRQSLEKIKSDAQVRPPPKPVVPKAAPAAASAKPSRKTPKRIEGQHEMLLPISGRTKEEGDNPRPGTRRK